MTGPTITLLRQTAGTVEERVPREVVLDAVRRRTQAERDAIAAAVAEGRVIHATANCAHHYSCPTIAHRFEVRDYEHAPDAELASQYDGVIKGWYSPSWRGDVVKTAEALLSPLDAEAVRGLRRCFVCAPVMPDPPAKAPRAPRDRRVSTLRFDDVGRTYDGARIAAVVLAADAVAVVLDDGRSMKFEPADRIVLGMAP